MELAEGGGHATLPVCTPFEHGTDTPLGRQRQSECQEPHADAQVWERQG